MKDNKPFAITAAFFIALLFLSSASSEPNFKKTSKLVIKRTSKAPKQSRAVQSLQNRIDRFVESKKKIDNDMAAKRKEIRKSSGSKRDTYKKQLKRLQTRNDRINKRIEKLQADIKRIEKK